MTAKKIPETARIAVITVEVVESGVTVTRDPDGDYVIRNDDGVEVNVGPGSSARGTIQALSRLLEEWDE